MSVHLVGIKMLCFIGVGRFRILGGGGGGHGKAKFPAGTLRRHVPTRFLINQCQIITFLILKCDNIENSRIELKGIVLPIPSNQIKVTFIIFTLQLGSLVGGGGAKGMLPPLLKLLGVLALWPLAPPPFLRQCVYRYQGSYKPFLIER